MIKILLSSLLINIEESENTCFFKVIIKKWINCQIRLNKNIIPIELWCVVNLLLIDRIFLVIQFGYSFILFFEKVFEKMWKGWSLSFIVSIESSLLP